MALLIALVALLAAVVGPSGSAAAPAAGAKNCPVTIATRTTAPPLRRTGNYHGTNALFTTLWPKGIARARADDDLRPDGRIWIKFPWWKGPGGYGKLRITGAGVGGTIGTVSAHIPSGYGRSFQATAIIFPREGCFRVTATSGSARVSFVTFVLVER